MKIVTLGKTLSIFFAVSLTLCMVWSMATPQSLHMHAAWKPLLPGFNWSITGYFIGLVWTVAYGWYVAVVFVPLYNCFHKRASS